MKKFLFLFALVLSCTRIETILPPIDGVIWQSEQHIAFPSVERLDNGELVCVYRHGEGHVSPDGTILLSRSNNNGASWAPPDTIIDTRLDCRDPSITQLSDGSLLLAFFQTRYDTLGKIIGAVGVYVSRSLDGGQSWFSPKMIITEDYDWAAVSSKIIELKSGELLLPIYAGKKNEKSVNIVCISKDNGKKWDEKHIMAADTSGKIDFNEPVLHELPDGKILCISRTAGADHFQYRNYSQDGGKTWTTPERTNMQGQAAGLLLTKDNILVCGYRDFSPNGTSYSLSYDFGKIFENETIIDLFHRDRAYPEFVEVEDKVLSVYYTAQKGDSKILVSEIDAKRILPPSGVKASVQPDSTIALRWNRNPKTHYYNVYRAIVDSTKDNYSHERVATVVNNFYNDKEAQAGFAYEYRISAIASISELVNESGAESEKSEPAEIQL
jgi:hypothetical protein